MTERFLGEIRLNGQPYAPRGWAMCNGQILSIAQNTALFSIIGTTYGGNGQTTFQLPDLRGRMPMHDNSAGLGQSGGTPTHTLSANEMPNHTHAMMADKGTATMASPAGAVLGNVPPGGTSLFHAPDGSAAMHPGSVGLVGGSQPHENMQPYLALNFIIAVQGTYPSQS